MSSLTSSPPATRTVGWAKRNRSPFPDNQTGACHAKKFVFVAGDEENRTAAGRDR